MVGPRRKDRAVRGPPAVHDVTGGGVLHLLYGDGVGELPAMLPKQAVRDGRELAREPKEGEFDPVAGCALVFPERPSVGSPSPDRLGRSGG